jgi:hypothetical protein
MMKEHTVTRNAVRDQVVCVKLLVRIREPRQAKGMVENFASIYFILVLGKKFIQEKKFQRT